MRSMYIPKSSSMIMSPVALVCDVGGDDEGAGLT